MKKFLCIFIIALFLLACKSETKKEPAETQELTETALIEDIDLSFEEQLDQSPRHHEWITLESNGDELYTFVAYPESSDNAKAVIVIHENRGLNEWARYFVDILASEGFIVLAPDLLSNFEEGIKKTTEFENSDAAREAIYALNADDVTADLNTVYDYAKNLDAASGEVAVVGFCWGGSQTFRYATNNAKISSANVFYGTAPDDALKLKSITVPIYGYYGGNDNRVNATIPRTDSIMQAAGLTYEYEIYDGAGHAFMRRGAEPDSDQANKEAHDKAWQLLLDKLHN